MADFEVVTHIAEVKSALKTQLKQAAEVIRGKMESHAKLNITQNVYDTPETWYRRTGLLRNSITTKVAEDGGDIVIAVGTNVEYAPYVELGTGVHAKGESKAKEIPWHFMGSDGKWHTTSGVLPRPYLRPAVEDNTAEYKAVLEKCLKD